MSVAAATRTRRARRALVWAQQRDPIDLALGLPLLIAAVYLARLAQTFQDRLTVVGGDSDAISALFIAATMDEVPDADVHMGTFGHYIVLWYVRATEWLPLSRELWQAIPPALWIASVGIVVWAAWRTVGRHVALLTGVLGFCVSPLLLYMLFTSSYHTWTLYSSAIAVGLAVYLTSQARLGARSWVVAVAAALALGAALASDPLVLVGAIGPLLVASAGVPIRHPTRQGRIVGLAAGAVGIGAIAIAAGLTQIMEASGFVLLPRTDGWKEAHLFFSQTAALLEEAVLLFNGYFFGRPLSIESTLAFATALGMMAALIAPFIVLRRRLHEPRLTDKPLELGQSAYIFFWAATMAIVPLAAIASDENVVAGGRWVLPMLFAAAATVPLLARSATARYLVIAGVSIYALLGVLNIDMRGESPQRTRAAAVAPVGFDVGDSLETSAGRVAIQANELISIAEKEDAHVGYAGYWEAASSSWSTKLRVKVFPVDYNCEWAADGVPCPHQFFVHAGWYAPRPDIRTFLIGPKPGDADAPEDADSYEPSPALGRPLATHRLSNGLRLYVYPYDIASRFPSFRVEPADDDET